MANFGLCKGYVAKKTGLKQYTDGFKIGDMVSTSVEPTYVEASLYGDNKMVRNVKRFSSATVSLGVTEVPAAAAEVLFGHAVDADTKKEVSKSGDAGNSCGYGFISNETEGDKDIFVAVVLHDITFAEGANSYTTQGESITFATPTLNATGKPDADDEWRTKQPFDTEKEAEDFIKQFLGIN